MNTIEFTATNACVLILVDDFAMLGRAVSEASCVRGNGAHMEAISITQAPDTTGPR